MARWFVILTNRRVPCLMVGADPSLLPYLSLMYRNLEQVLGPRNPLRARSCLCPSRLRTRCVVAVLFVPQYAPSSSVFDAC